MEKQRKSRLKSLNEVISEPYYLFHFMAFFAYLPLRTSMSSLFSPHVSSHLFQREIQAILTFLVLTAVKIVKEETWEGFIADSLFFAKIFLLVLSFIVDYHLALCYSLVFFVTYIVTEQPVFDGVGVSSRLTPLQLEALLTEGNTTRFWLVEFRASSSSSCIRTSRCFPELSITYSNQNLSFGIVDLGLFPNAAEKFGISFAGGMGQLPTYIMFENATEVTRFPEFNFEARPSHSSATKRFLSRHFELDRHLLDYVNGK